MRKYLGLSVGLLALAATSMDASRSTYEFGNKLRKSNLKPIKQGSNLPKSERKKRRDQRKARKINR